MSKNLEIIYPTIYKMPYVVERNPLVIYPTELFKPLIIQSPYFVDVVHHIKNNYETLENNKQVIKTVIKYYYYKILEKWLKGPFIDLLGFFKIVDNNVKFIENMNEMQKELDTSQNENLKIKYIEDNILSKSIIKELLTKFIEKNSYKWYKIQNHEEELKLYLHSKIKNLFESQVGK